MTTRQPTRSWRPFARVARLDRRQAPPTGWAGRLRALGRAGAAAWLVVACVLLLRVTGHFYPFEHWLLFRYLYVWGLSALFFCACLTSGLRVLAWLESVPGRVEERFVFAFALGALLFACGVLVAGLLSVLRPGLFFVLPGMLLVWGAPSAGRSGLRLAVHLRRFGLRLAYPRNAVEVLALGLLACGCLVLLLQVLTPENLGADAHGYHLPIAEHYVAAGKIRAFAEGWYLGAYPQLASLLYTWAYLAPGSPSLHTALCSALEWVIFLVTLAGLPALVRRLIRRRVPFAAAGVFLFPGIFFYDSNLITTADHVLAFWTVPLALALLALARRFQTREAVLVGLLLSGGLLTKYQGVYLVAAAAPVVLLLALRAERARPVLALACSVLVGTSGHWLKNWVFYGAPAYPWGWHLLRPHPLHPHAIAYMLSDFGPFPPGMTPRGPLGPRLLELVQVLARFSFVRNGFLSLPAAPLFGSLFTLLVPLTILLRAPRRLWLLVLSIHVALASWWLSFHFDRYLQILLPPMAAATVAILVLAWNSGRLVRTAAAALVALHTLWGADTWSFREHAWIGDNPLKRFVDHVALGHLGRYAERDRPQGALAEFHDKLPPHAKLLVHDLNSGQLGAGAQIVQDALGWQGAIAYSQHASPAVTAELWRALGVTHLVWYPEREALEYPRLVGEIAFRRAVFACADDLGTLAGRRYFALRATPEPTKFARESTRVAWLGCGELNETGLYTVDGLMRHEAKRRLERRELKRSPSAALSDANALVERDGCKEAALVERVASADFVHTGRAGRFTLWVRRAADERGR